MKVLLFTHIDDIDGLGCAILASYAFEKLDYKLCSYQNLEKEYLKLIKTKEIYLYDLIYFTDLCLSENHLKEIYENNKLKEKVFVFDHHPSKFQEKNLNITIKIQDEKGLCSGTSLLYQHLLYKNYLKETNAINDFVELTRRYDTWEWKTIYQDEKSHELTLLFYQLGYQNYIDLMLAKLKNENEFNFNKFELNLIKSKKTEIEEKISYYIDNIINRKILNQNVAIIFIEYELRNDLSEALKILKPNYDSAIFISLDKNKISYRSLKENISVQEIAKLFKGSGHKEAAGSIITLEQLETIIKILFDSKL